MEALMDSWPNISRESLAQGRENKHCLVLQNGNQEWRRYPVSNWQHLPGVEVEVWKGTKLIRAGIVETVSQDGRYIWIAQNGPLNRTLFDKTGGFRVLL
jgi:hypothetical protein